MSKPKGTIFFMSFLEVANTLPTAEDRWSVFVALMKYNATGEMPTFTDAKLTAFYATKQVIDENCNRWEQKSEARSAAGKKGAGARWAPERGMASDGKNGTTKGTLNETSNKTSNHTLLAESVNVIPSYISLSEKPADGSTRGNQTNSLRAKHLEAYDFWERIRKVYPSARRHAPGLRTLRFIEDGKLWEQEEAITKSVVAWSNCEEWKQGYVLRMSRFIEEEHWKEEPPGPKHPQTFQHITSTHAPRDECSEDTDIPTL